MKVAVCIATGGVDVHGYLERYANGFSEAATARGLDVEVIRHSQPDFHERIFNNLAMRDCIVHFYGYLFDLPHFKVNGQRIDPIDASNATIVTSIGDHPFATFMHRTVQNAHPRMKFVVMDGAFKSQMQTMNALLADAFYEHQPVPPPTNFDSAARKIFSERNFDLVVPMYICDMRGNDINFVLSQLSPDWFVKIISETYEEARANPETPIFGIFVTAFHRHVGLTLADVAKRNPPIIPHLLNAVTAVDAILRQERRRQMVSTLLRDVGGLNVALTCDSFPDLTVDKNVKFLGRKTADEVSVLVADARAILNCNPSYPTSLHERIVTGMQYGSCVITDENNEVRRRFNWDEYIAVAPRVPQTIADIFATRDIEAIAAAGLNKVTQDRTYSWDGHIDGLVRAAAA